MQRCRALVFLAMTSALARYRDPALPALIGFNLLVFYALFARMLTGREQCSNHAEYISSANGRLRRLPSSLRFLVVPAA